MATVVAIRYNPPIGTAYHRWCRAGKPHKVALTAAMHKVLIHLNAMLKSQTPWRRGVGRPSTAPA